MTDEERKAKSREYQHRYYMRNRERLLAYRRRYNVQWRRKERAVPESEPVGCVYPDCEHCPLPDCEREGV